MSPCCSNREQEDCCDPAEKDSCCTAGTASCGCSAGAVAAADLREPVRERYAASASAIEQHALDAIASALGA
jgi:hypothetical protein